VLLKLYEGLLLFLSKALEALKRQDHAKKGLYSHKALSILTELLASLDPQKNPDFSSQLTDLYIYIIDRISYGNAHNHEQAYKEAISLLEPLREAWEDVVKHPREDGVPSPHLQPEEYAKYLKKSKKSF
jgi:flagellar protein FliS